MPCKTSSALQHYQVGSYHPSHLAFLNLHPVLPWSHFIFGTGDSCNKYELQLSFYFLFFFFSFLWDKVEETSFIFIYKITEEMVEMVLELCLIN